MSNEDLKQKLSVIISATNTSGNQKLDAIMELISTPSKELIHEYFDNCSTRPAASIESKELKSAAEVITEQIGIRLDAPKQTPMDKGECIVCMEAYASQLHPSPTHDVEDGKQGGEELPDKIKKIIEEESYKEEIYPKKYGSGSRDGYNTMMLYEINSERSECFSKGAEFGYRLAQPSTPVQDGWVEKTLFDFFIWFRANGELYIDRSIEAMIQIYLAALPSPPVNKQD